MGAEGLRRDEEEVNSMCVAFPGTVRELGENGKRAKVDFGGTQLEVQTGSLPVQTGDRVLVHAGYVLQVLMQEDADAMEEIFSEIAQLEGTDHGSGDR